MKEPSVKGSPWRTEPTSGLQISQRSQSSGSTFSLNVAFSLTERVFTFFYVFINEKKKGMTLVNSAVIVFWAVFS